MFLEIYTNMYTQLYIRAVIILRVFGDRFFIAAALSEIKLFSPSQNSLKSACHFDLLMFEQLFGGKVVY